MTFAQTVALTFSVANIVGKVIGMFVLTTAWYYQRRLAVSTVMFASSAFFTGFGIAAFDPTDGFLFASPGMQIFVSAFLGALPCSVLYGAIFSYIEGRRSTDILIAAMNFTLIAAGGASRSTAAALIAAGVPPYLMPAVAAVGAAVVAIPLLHVVARLPSASQLDVEQRSQRGAMSCKQKLELFRHYRFVVPAMIVAYTIIMGLRQYRDFFAVELYAQALGYTASSWTYLVFDLPGALLSCACVVRASCVGAWVRACVRVRACACACVRGRVYVRTYTCVFVCAFVVLGRGRAREHGRARRNLLCRCSLLRLPALPFLTDYGQLQTSFRFASPTNECGVLPNGRYLHHCYYYYTTTPAYARTHRRYHCTDGAHRGPPPGSHGDVWLDDCRERSARLLSAVFRPDGEFFVLWLDGWLGSWLVGWLVGCWLIRVSWP